MKGVLILLLISLLIPITTEATTIPVEFSRITSNNAENVEAQLVLEILDPADALATYGYNIDLDQVLFTFKNNVGTPSNITEIYVDDGTIIGLFSVLNAPTLGGMGFTDFIGSTVIPTNLPGGNTVVPPFVADVMFSADTVSGPPANGIDQAADILGIIYDVSGGITGVDNALDDGSLRVGLHVRSIGAAGGSDSFVNNGINGVPEPGGLCLSLGALFLLFGIGAKRMRKI